MLLSISNHARTFCIAKPKYVWQIVNLSVTFLVFSRLTEFRCKLTVLAGSWRTSFFSSTEVFVCIFRVYWFSCLTQRVWVFARIIHTHTPTQHNKVFRQFWCFKVQCSSNLCALATYLPHAFEMELFKFINSLTKWFVIMYLAQMLLSIITNGTIFFP